MTSSLVGDTGIEIKIKAEVYDPDTDSNIPLDIVTGSPALSILVFRDVTDSVTLTSNITAAQVASDYFATWDQPDSDDTILTVPGNYKIYLKVVFSSGQTLTSLPFTHSVRRVN